MKKPTGLHWKKDGTAKCGKYFLHCGLAAGIDRGFAQAVYWHVAIKRVAWQARYSSDKAAKAAAESWLRKQAAAMQKALGGGK